MKILGLHVDYINFKPLKKALKGIAGLSEKEKKGSKNKESLAVLTAVEKHDSNVEKVVEAFVKNVKELAEQVNAKNVVLYPYAHLSKELASPEVAQEVLEKAEKELKKVFSVSRAPFGYYKEFEMKVKGHALSELSRDISVGSSEKEDVEESYDKNKLLRKMTKIRMSAPRGKSDLKSHVEIGRELDLYVVSDIIGGGLPLFTPKGTTIRREIERFITDEELKRGYLYTSTPVMAKSDLFKVSGHWQKYKDDMFVLDVHGEKFALRPMTCPFQFVLYKRKPRSYKDLPLKYAENATLFRNEKSGELRGLTRVRQLDLADAHVICTPEQMEKEFENVMDLINYVMKSLGVKDVWYRFSKWDQNNKEKYIDNPKAWEKTQKDMKNILDKLGIKYVEAEGEAAFYGPKLDLQYKDVYGKEDTLITVQIDFASAERFGMVYKDKDNKEKTPMIIHRSSTGATERMMSYLLEKTQGNLPLWISPNQVKVLTMNESVEDYSVEVLRMLRSEGLRAEIDDSGEKIGKKVRNAQIEKFNYMVTIGDKEKDSETLAIRSRDGKVEYDIKVEDFVSKVKDEIKERK